MGDDFLLGFLALALQSVLLHFQTRAAMVAPPQFHDALAQSAQGA
jgi:hypothetical protein